MVSNRRRCTVRKPPDAATDNKPGTPQQLTSRRGVPVFLLQN